MFPLTVLMGSTRSTPHLSRKRPSGNLLSLVNVCCVLGHMVLCFCFQMTVFNLSRFQAVSGPGGTGNREARRESNGCPDGRAITTALERVRVRPIDCVALPAARWCPCAAFAP